jgi:cytochrome c-type biogenesis protein CcmH/NrfG
MPLGPNDSRPTDGLAGSGQARPTHETSRIKLGEMEQLLQHPSTAHPASVKDGNEPATHGHAHNLPPPAETLIYAAPKTNELATDTATKEISASQVSTDEIREQPPRTSSNVRASTHVKPRPRRRWLLLPVIIAAFLIVVASVALVALYLSRRQASTNTNGVPAASPAEQDDSVESQLAEAESLLGSGETDSAISRLREVVRRDPSNAKAHRLLGEALLRNGARREAIEAYANATRNDPADTVAWRALASAQFAEALYADAVESYRRLIALTGEDKLDDNARLEFADALRLAGYTEEARAAYQRVAANAPEDLARAARRHLAELPQSKQSPAASPEPSRPEESVETASNGSKVETVTPVAVASPSPAQTATPPQPSPTPAAKQTLAQTDPDADYAQALNLIGGRDLKTVPRPELLRALELFQRASKGGARSTEARRQAERLGREFDRRRKQK